MRVHTRAQRSVNLLILLHQNSKLMYNFTGKPYLKVSSWKLSGMRYVFVILYKEKASNINVVFILNWSCCNFKFTHASKRTHISARTITVNHQNNSQSTFKQLEETGIMIVNKRNNTKSAWKYQRFTGVSIWIRGEVKSFMVFLTILWLCSKRLPSKTTLYDVVINSELAVLPEKLCCIWTATRDLKLRKYNYPLNYRYGVSLLINRRPLHVILFILLAGDVATNPGPFSAHDGQVKSFVLNARSPKSFHRDEQSNLIVCNLQRFQDLVPEPAARSAVRGY